MAATWLTLCMRQGLIAAGTLLGAASRNIHSQYGLAQVMATEVQASAPTVRPTSMCQSQSGQTQGCLDTLDNVLSLAESCLGSGESYRLAVLSLLLSLAATGQGGAGRHLGSSRSQVRVEEVIDIGGMEALAVRLSRHTPTY